MRVANALDPSDEPWFSFAQVIKDGLMKGFYGEFAPRAKHFATQAGVVQMFMEQNLELTRFALENASAGKKDLMDMVTQLREENHLLKRQQIEEREVVETFLDVDTSKTSRFLRSAKKTSAKMKRSRRRS